MTTVVLTSMPPPTQWTYPLCGCFDDFGLCLDVCCCYCCQHARTCAAVDRKADDPNWIVCCGLFVGAYFLTDIVFCLSAWYQRDSFRKKYGIEGSCCADCCLSLCCSPCVICQLHRELHGRGINPGHCCCAEAPIETRIVVPANMVQPAYAAQPAHPAAAPAPATTVQQPTEPYAPAKEAGPGPQDYPAKPEQV